MSIDRIVMAFAGAMVLLSVTLAHFFSPWWMLLAAFVGFNLIQASFTGFCPLAMALKRFGVKPGPAF
jgi:membrane protein implicated in regulation of membrane protease activity